MIILCWRTTLLPSTQQEKGTVRLQRHAEGGAVYDRIACTVTLVQQGDHIHVRMRVQARRQLAVLGLRQLSLGDRWVVVPGCTHTVRLSSSL